MLTHVMEKKRGPAGSVVVRRKAAPSAAALSRARSVQRAEDAQVRAILRGTGAQAKLRVNEPGDAYEQEADRVADKVMRMPEPVAAVEGVAAGSSGIQRKCSPCSSGQGLCPQCAEEESLQRKPLAETITPLIQRQAEAPEEEEEEGTVQTKRAGSGVPEVTPDLDASIHTMRGGGQLLPQSERAFFEPRFGTDFSHVRLHTDARAAETAQALGARAFTLGSDIAFAKGQYSPTGSGARHLLAHELTHTVQQNVEAHVRENPGRLRQGPVSETSGSLASIWRWSTPVQPTIQRDFAIRPPHPAAVPGALTPPRMQAAIDFNRRVLGSIPNSADVISRIRDVLGTSPMPATINADFVNAVMAWQAVNGIRQDGMLGPRSARPLFREIGAEGVGECRVKSGPTYRPGGTLAPAPAGPGRESAPFRFNAEFDSDPAANVFPSCCEVRQSIRWNPAAAASFAAIRGAGNTVPHAGFPAAHPANRWIEDRNATNGRYGHRSGGSSIPRASNRYLDTSGRRNQAFGHIYRGRDNPGGPVALAGQWRFMLRVLDVCNSGVRRGWDFIRINW